MPVFHHKCANRGVIPQTVVLPGVQIATIEWFQISQMPMGRLIVNR